MSGIAGLFRLDGGTAERETVRGIAEHIAYRGPDASGDWFDGPVGLAHHALHATPEAHLAPQPLRDEAHGTVFVGDVRFDNRADLVRRLGLPEPPHRLTDGHLALAAYARWGADLTDEVLGDFAFAIWDARQRRLFCARDPFGIKPFSYVYREGRHFAFASDPSALLALPGMAPAVNETRLAQLLAGNSGEESLCLLDGIKRLPPACRCMVTLSGVTMERYWFLRPPQPEPRRSDAEYIEGFREHFAEAVRCRLRSPLPVATQLSGGLDSTSVTCMARDVLRAEGREAPHTYSMVFSEHPTSDERPFIEPAVAMGGLQPHFIDADQLSPFGNLEHVYARMDDGLAAGNQHFIWSMLSAAKGENVRVMLDGQYGDRVVEFGFTRLTELMRNGEWDVYADEVKRLTSRHREAEKMQGFERDMVDDAWHLDGWALAQLGRLADRGAWRAFFEASQAVERHFAIPRRTLLRRFGRRLMTPWPLLRLRRRLAHTEPDLPPLLDPEFARAVGFAPHQPEGRPDLQPHAHSVRELQRVALAQSKRETFEVLDHFGARFGVEQRQPFMDLRLINFCLRLPSDLSLRDGWLRYVIREAMEGILPDEVRWRVGKGDMGSHFEDAVRKYDRARVMDHLNDPGRLAPYLNRAHLDYLRDNFDTLHGVIVLDINIVVALSLWARRWLP